MKKICFIVATPATARVFLKDHINVLSNEYQVYLVANIKNKKELSDLKLEGYYNLDISRVVCLKKDFKALVDLLFFFRKMKFYSVHSVTPKAGLLTSLAAFFTRIPHRIHLFTGQVWCNETGFKRRTFIFLDKIIATLNTNLLVDGYSQRSYLIKNKILKQNKSIVLGNGSISGVNLLRFKPDRSTRLKYRNILNISEERTVFVFLGRLKKEKGIYELLSAFNQIASYSRKAYLLLIGPDEEKCIDKIILYSNIKKDENFCYYGVTITPEYIMQAGDVFVLPSYREGFGTSVIEAASLGIPAICSDIYGLKDTVIDGTTGFFCKVMDTESLAIFMKKMMDDKLLRKKMGKNSQRRIQEKFSSDFVSQEWLHFYKKLKK